MSKTIEGIGGKYVVTDENGRQLQAGDEVTTFRGESARVLRIAAPRVPGKSAKVETTLGVHYAEVYSLTVDGPLTTVTTRACFVCGNTSQVEVTAEQARQITERRTPVQDVLPDMPRAEREVLITGTHPGCWDEIFG